MGGASWPEWPLALEALASKTEIITTCPAFDRISDLLQTVQSSWQNCILRVGESLGQWERAECDWIHCVQSGVSSSSWTQTSLCKERVQFLWKHLWHSGYSLWHWLFLMLLTRVQACSSWCVTVEIILKVMLLEGWCQYKRMGHGRSLMTWMASGPGGFGL